MLECLDADWPARELEQRLVDRPDLLPLARRVLARALDEERAPPLTAGGVGEIPGFRIVDELGAGGMGVVYRAEQEHPRRTVALKVIRVGMGRGKARQRFELERQSLARMNHDGIARVYEVGTCSGGEPYFAMEYVDGMPLTDYCDRERLPTADRLHLFRRVCDGVQHAHEKGVIHRDLKPSNILVATGSDAAVPKLIDFGLALEHDETGVVTDVGQVLGTPAYMSPEQASARLDAIDTRSDIYSLGVTLYELLAGSLPFDPDHLANAGMLEVQRILTEDEPPRPSTRVSTGATSSTAAEERSTSVTALSRQLRGDLDWIVMRAMAKEPSERYASAHELGADLQRFLENRPVQARPPSVAYRVRKFARRYHVQVSAAALVLMAMVAGTVLSTLGFLEAKESAGIAERESTVRARSSYLANVAASNYALADSNSREAKLRLEACRPERPTWEWDHLSASMQAIESSTERVLEGHEGYVMSLAFVPDTSHLLSGSLDGTWRKWDTETGELLATVSMPDLPPGSQFPTDAVLEVAVSPDAQLLATGHVSGMVRLWDLEAGEELRAWQRRGNMFGVAFSPDGSLLAMGDGLPESPHQFKVNVFDLGAGEFVRQLEHRGPVGTFGLEFSPDGTLLAEGSNETVRIFDVVAGSLVRELEVVNGRASNVEFDRSGERLLVGGSLCRATRVFDVASGNLTALFQAATGSGGCAAWGPGETTVLTGDDEARVLRWRITDTQIDQQLLGHTRTVLELAVAENGRFASAGEDGTIRVWRSQPERTTFEDIAVPRAASGISLSHDGSRALFVSLGGHFAAYGSDGEPKQGEWPVEPWERRFGLVSPPRAVVAAVLHPADEERMAFAVVASDVSDNRANGRLLLGRLGEEPLVVEIGEQPWLAEFTPDGSRVVTVGIFGTIGVFDAESGERLQTMSRSDLGVEDIAIHPAGDELVAVVKREELCFWNLETGELRHAITVDATVDGIDYYPDGERLVVAEDDTVSIRDARSGAQLEVWAGHQGIVRGVSVSPDGARVVSVGSDKSVRLWDPLDGANVLVLQPAFDANLARFSGDGNWLVAGGSNGEMRYWRRTLATE